MLVSYKIVQASNKENTMAIRGNRLRWPPRPGRRLAGTRATLASDEQQPSPRQPNEHDESADSQASGLRPIIRRAHDDLVAERQDTDCRNSVGEIVKKNSEGLNRRRK
jgi:hypothetical protein